MVEIATQALVHLTFRNVDNKRRLGGWGGQVDDSTLGSVNTGSGSSSGSGNGSGGDSDSGGGATSSSNGRSSSGDDARTRASENNNTATTATAGAASAVIQAVFPTLIQCLQEQYKSNEDLCHAGLRLFRGCLEVGGLCIHTYTNTLSHTLTHTSCQHTSSLPLTHTLSHPLTHEDLCHAGLRLFRGCLEVGGLCIHTYTNTLSHIHYHTLSHTKTSVMRDYASLEGVSRWGAFAFTHTLTPSHTLSHTHLVNIHHHSLSHIHYHTLSHTRTFVMRDYASLEGVSRWGAFAFTHTLTPSHTYTITPSHTRRPLSCGTTPL